MNGSDKMVETSQPFTARPEKYVPRNVYTVVELFFLDVDKILSVVVLVHDKWWTLKINVIILSKNIFGVYRENVIILDIVFLLVLKMEFFFPG